MDGLSYKFTLSDGRNVARVACWVCGAEGDLIWPPTRGHAPEAVAKGFVRLGWDFDMHTRRLCRCPEHAKRGKRVTRSTAAVLKVHDGLPAPSDQVVKTTPALTPQILAQEASPPQKKAIRDRLDGLFDEVRGCYLEGYTDQRLGVELGLPWALVAYVRETAYGAIRSDPAVQVLIDKLTALESVLGTERNSLDSLRASVDNIWIDVKKLVAERQAGAAS